METFTYKPLTNKLNIRLLQVTIDQNHQLNCTLEEHFLPDEYQPKEAPTKYAALSYTWGDAQSTIPITCNGAQLHITTNLAEALHMATQRNPNEYLWVDQICINQQDNNEKSQQVGRMRKIYSMAITVLAWLGPQRHDTAVAVDWIERLARPLRGFGNDAFRHGEFWEERQETEKHEHLTLEQSAELGVPFDDEASWEAFATFYDSPWFERIWVVQEVLPAREALIIRGEHAVDWHLVKAAAAWYQYKACDLRIKLAQARERDGTFFANQMNLTWNGCYGAEFLGELLNQTVRPTHWWELPELLRTFRTRKATDARDMMYALLGLSTIYEADTRSELTSPDYNKSVKDTYRDVLRGYIEVESYDNLKLLWNALPHSQDPDWPSWVPDWRRTEEYTGHGRTLPADEPAGRQNRQSSGETPEMDADGLVVQGHVLGTVISQSEYDCGGPLYSNLRSSRDAFVKEYHSAFGSEYIHSADGLEDINTAFVMSLTAGRLFSTFEENGTGQKEYSDSFVEMVETLFTPEPTEAEGRVKYEKLMPYFKLGLPDFGNEWGKWSLPHYCERRWFITDTGYVGIGNHQMQLSDQVAVLWGLDRACILRPLGRRGNNGDEWFSFVGEAYCRNAKEAIEKLPVREDGTSIGTNLVLR